MVNHFERYLNRYSEYTPLISAPPHQALNNIVIIPVYNEPDILKTCESLLGCSNPLKATEVILLINQSEEAHPEIKDFNLKTYHQLMYWCTNNSKPEFMFYPVFADQLPKKHAGVGLARKLAMDEAVSRLSRANNSDGIIFSVDADTLVSENYLTQIESSYQKNPKAEVILPGFEHQLSDDSYLQKAIVLYELHLRYFKLALKATGFPFSYHTIGSALTVKANAYVKEGGMSKKQAGEDFYFLHKVFKANNTIELKDTFVYPSARKSNRVPFGTGAAIIEITEKNDYKTYNPEFFKYIEILFRAIPHLFKANIQQIIEIYKTLHPSLQHYILADEFEASVITLNKNSSRLETFTINFYQYFNAFWVIKYLNKVHSDYGKIDVISAVNLFLKTEEYEYNIVNLLAKLKQKEYALITRP